MQELTKSEKFLIENLRQYQKQHGEIITSERTTEYSPEFLMWLYEDEDFKTEDTAKVGDTYVKEIKTFKSQYAYDILLEEKKETISLEVWLITNPDMDTVTITKHFKPQILKDNKWQYPTKDECKNWKNISKELRCIHMRLGLIPDY